MVNGGNTAILGKCYIRFYGSKGISKVENFGEILSARVYYKSGLMDNHHKQQRLDSHGCAPR